MSRKIHKCAESSHDALYKELLKVCKTEKDKALALEASRAKKRLDILDKTLDGDKDIWMSITHDQNNSRVIKIDSAVRESRQLSLTLKQLLEHFDDLYSDEDKEQKEDNILDNL